MNYFVRYNTTARRWEYTLDEKCWHPLKEKDPRKPRHAVEEAELLTDIPFIEWVVMDAPK